MGRSLVAGRTYTLVVDADWRDADGQHARRAISAANSGFAPRGRRDRPGELAARDPAGRHARSASGLFSAAARLRPASEGAERVIGRWQIGWMARFTSSPAKRAGSSPRAIPGSRARTASSPPRSSKTWRVTGSGGRSRSPSSITPQNSRLRGLLCRSGSDLNNRHFTFEPIASESFFQRIATAPSTIHPPPRVQIIGGDERRTTT